MGHSNPAMTRHYTHVGEVAAGLAVAALPTVIGEVPAEPPKRQEGEILREIKTMVANIVTETWSDKKAALLELLSKLPT